MTNHQALILAGTLLLGLGMVGEYGPRWLRAFQELEERRLAHGGLYPAQVVGIAVRGALIAHADLEDDVADRTAAVVVDELESNDVVFDGHEWRRLSTIDPVDWRP